MDVFVAWTVAAPAALGLLAALARGAAELRDRHSRKQRAARRVCLVAVPPRSALKGAAPATSRMPTASDPVAGPVVEQPVLGRLEYPTEIGELLDDRDPGGSDEDPGSGLDSLLLTWPNDEPVFGGSDENPGSGLDSLLLTWPNDEPVFGGSDENPGSGLDSLLLTWPNDEPVFGGSDENPGSHVPQDLSATPPSPCSEDAPIINESRVPLAVPASQDPTTTPAPMSTPQVLPASPVPALLVLACRGVQIGDENEQFNTYTYKLQNPTVDFAEVLGRPAVRDALSRLIMDPKNDELRIKAAEALSAGEWTGGKEELLDLGPLGRRSPHSDVTRDLKAMQGFITVRNCQGVQTGNTCHQWNYFIYACRRATVNASSLLKAHPEVTSALIDAVIMPSQKKWKEPGEKLNATVRAALNSPESLDAIPDRSINVSPQSAGVVRDRDGVSIGDRCHAADSKAVMVELRDPSNLYKCVLKESRHLMVHMATQLRRQDSASTSALDVNRRSPNRRLEPPSGPERPSSGRGIGL
ncbi:RIP homotypic interaction motif-containing protein [Streptomyces sp. NBC_00648]|uniref:RIP homotypic interaction motif-containing protein n=1 Tax=Streptomyces sp. NBC_00648 TaxID=2975797 RepID=UPI0032434A13